MAHDFRTSLAFSHKVEDEPFWLEVYAHAFPDMVTMVSHRENGYWQKAGVDRSIILSTSKQILIDEKVRRKNYGDILLEYWSDRDRKVPGWAVKPLLADYIAYAILPRGLCFFLPVIQMQEAWRINGEAWMSRYRKVPAENSGPNGDWITLSCAVPMKELYGAIGNCLRCVFEVPT